MKQKTSQERLVHDTRTEISLRTTESIIKEIDKDKEGAKKDITSFCRDKAIELLHGCSIESDRVRDVNVLETLQILNFLAILGAVN